MAKWQPIETAPDNDKDCLIFCPEGFCTKVFVACRLEGEWTTPEMGVVALISGNPSHWKRLPNPPFDDGIERYSLPNADWTKLMLGTPQAGRQRS